MYTVFIQPLTNRLIVNANQQFLKTGLSLNSEINVAKRKIIKFFIQHINAASDNTSMVENGLLLFAV
jgi:hypothetical protein